MVKHHPRCQLPFKMLPFLVLTMLTARYDTAVCTCVQQNSKSVRTRAVLNTAVGREAETTAAVATIFPGWSFFCSLQLRVCCGVFLFFQQGTQSSGTNIEVRRIGDRSLESGDNSHGLRTNTLQVLGIGAVLG